jgi:lysozyme family protein
VRARAFLALLFVVLCAAALPAAGAAGPNLAALQVTLRARGLYGGDVDGLRGPATTRAIRRFQRRAGIAVDGIFGPQTRRALGRYARPRYRSRLLVVGRHGWDVAALQFSLGAHGFPSGAVDGVFGPRTWRALVRFQRRAGLAADGAAGRATYGALRRRPPRSPLSLARPVAARIGDHFGPRGNRFHAGLDFVASYGARVRAARAGRVARAGWSSGGFGYLVVVRHRRHVRTFYAHLSAVRVRRGQRVARGRVLGRVGASGLATGPHLHFEVRVRGAAVNPLSALR